MNDARSKKARERTLEILDRRGSPLAAQLREQGDTPALRELIVDELTEEFATHGLKDDLEPSAYGLEIEDLIDVMNPAND